MSSTGHHDRRRDRVADFSLVDEHAHLDEQGWLLAWCVSTGGDRWPWLVAPTYIDAQHDVEVLHGCLCWHCAPHEQPGHLPPHVLDRVRLAPIRCGGTRLDGGRCRGEVSRHGDRCRWHRTDPPTTPRESA